MEYDPIKKHLGKIFKQNTLTLRLFFFILDLLFLRTWYIHKEIKRLSKKKGKNRSHSVLDAGSGFGQYSWYIARKYKNWNVLGIDIKEDEINESREFFKKAGLTNISFEVKDLVNFVSRESFDLILSVDVLEHIEDDIRVMKNSFESLRERGVLLISTPSDQGGSDINDDDDESFISEHVRDGYSVDDIKNKLSSVGFKKIDVKYSYGKPGNISWRLSVKIPVLLLNLSKFFLLLLPFYYLLVYPLCFLLNLIDLRINNKKGTGLIVVAEKY